jgi:hypothetical protein
MKTAAFIFKYKKSLSVVFCLLFTIQYVWENDWLEWKRGKTKNLLINTYG